MAYTAKQAMDTFDKYLNIEHQEKNIIPDTKERGVVYQLLSGESIVIFIYPLVHKQDNTKNYFDTRDSGAHERGVAWRYACIHKMKYFCIGVNDQVEKYKEYIFSLECDEKLVEKISGTKAGVRSGPGNQIIIPNDYIPSKKFERITNKLGIYISVVHKDSLIDYLEKYDNRPYMLSNNEDCESLENVVNEYQRAAQIIKEYILESGLQFEDTEEEIQVLHEEFKTRFSPEMLLGISDSELLKSMFYSAETTNDSLCYWLEFNQYSRKYCGSIAGGSSYKYGLFQRKEDGVWMTGSPNKPEELTDEQALEIARNIRDMLVKGADIIKNSDLTDLSSYEALDKELNDAIGKYATMGWVHKYFYMLYPDKLSAFHSTDWQRHVLFALRIRPSNCYFARSGQIAMVSHYANLYYRHLFESFINKFGTVKKFCRLGTSDREINYADEWKNHNLVAVGWDELGLLTDYVIGNDISKKVLAEKMQEIYYPDNAQMASRKAGEVVTFYRSNTDTVFVAMNGDNLLALVDEVGEYYFDADKSMSHRKAGIWHLCFAMDEKLPNQSAGHMTTCYELSDDDNLLYLYEKYYYDLSDKQEEEGVEEMKEFIPLILNTGLVTEFERNRIVFGAPGTGKSYKLKQDSEEILKNTEGSLERVTFHPDYSYSQFVGTYKPVSDANGDIRYKFVPGPFMRVYIDALKSGRSKNPQPHVLLVEEINRARVAAVFGDVFQLLDRDANGVSEYSIQSTEDIRKYLAEELGGKPEKYQYIQIPDNMFIWATMNSADQGVFPMDTAFKRRWSFQYIGIDDSEENVRDYEIPIGMGDNRKYINWNQLRKAINDILSDECKVNEDKLLGPFFISKSMLDNALQNEDKFVKAFESKVIMYLFEDVMKMRPSSIFKGHDKNNGKMIFSEICKAFEEQCEEIFGLKNMSYTKEIEQ